MDAEDQPIAARTDGANLLTELIAGSVGGACQVIVGQPLDTLKVRAQTAPPGTFKNTWDIARQTAAKEGVWAFYKGMASPLIGIAAVNSLLFAAYGTCKRAISPFGELSLPQTALAGMGAGVAQSVLASPVELGKIRMQAQYGGKEDKRLVAVITDLYKRYGLRHGIMRGFWATSARDALAYAGFYTGYEATKRALTPAGTKTPSTGVYLASGAVGGTCYWLACYPLDMVKSRVQLRAEPPRPGLGYIVTELSAIVRQGGVAGLFKGIVPTLLRAVPAAAVTFGAFELTKDFIVSNRLI
ncbi:putative mitochondrial ornithine transporter 1 [Filobasidium floriforme]|uniref:putative mitochondrial ornithine transporter 1 n=1 Tax=Filobasidium floriforme TaxID=5210 RepID=UPI001E8EA35D|nr:putative mitochondrial ornithine transporter 1 [Filobasidium floriforme]KAH8081197.1 putative mitochondrial ornithine transporter 1 [Filobasidium floriforme]